MTAKKLPPTAYELKEGEQYVPYLMTRAQPAAKAERRREQGVLFGAGLTEEVG